MPNLLWTPIERALSIDLPSFNHNFFGINQSVDIKLETKEGRYIAASPAYYEMTFQRE
jgi:hypothetical protein